MSKPSIPNPQDILARVRHILVERLGETFVSVPVDVDLRQTLGDGYDSLTATECIYAIEESFGIEVDFIADDVRYWFATLERMGEFVAGRLEDAGTTCA